MSLFSFWAKMSLYGRPHCLKITLVFFTLNKFFSGCFREENEPISAKNVNFSEKFPFFDDNFSYWPPRASNFFCYRFLRSVLLQTGFKAVLMRKLPYFGQKCQIFRWKWETRIFLFLGSVDELIFEIYDDNYPMKNIFMSLRFF